MLLSLFQVKTFLHSSPNNHFTSFSCVHQLFSSSTRLFHWLDLPNWPCQSPSCWNNMFNHAATRWQHNKDTYIPRISRIVCMTCYWLMRWRSFVCSLLLTALVTFTSLTKSLTVLYVINKPYYGSTYITQVTLLYSCANH